METCRSQYFVSTNSIATLFAFAHNLIFMEEGIFFTVIHNTNIKD